MLYVTYQKSGHSVDANTTKRTHDKEKPKQCTKKDKENGWSLCVYGHAVCRMSGVQKCVIMARAVCADSTLKEIQAHNDYWNI